MSATCPHCGRSKAQHGRMWCWQLDEMEKRTEYAALPLHKRLTTRRPKEPTR